MKREKGTSTLWTKNLDKPEDKEKFLESLRLSRTTLERLKEILEERKDSIVAKSTQNTNFILPSWSKRQAASMGEIRNIQFIIDLLGV